MLYLMIFNTLIEFMILIALCFIIYLIYKIKITQEKVKKQTEYKRIHPSLNKNDNNIFGGTKAYSLYKNENGLYEPLKPSKGINLKKGENISE